MGRKTLESKVTIKCPFCKTEELTIKVDFVEGFKTTKICPNCRFKFSLTFGELKEDNKREVSFGMIGISLVDNIPLKGLLSAQKSKVSGAVVALYRASEAGFYTQREYAVVCTKHETGNFYFFDSYGEVMKWQGKPDKWCSECKKEHGIKE